MFTLKRDIYDEQATLGRLVVGSTTFDTIERPWLDNKPFESCIPEGQYLCLPYSSPKYPNVWELQEVPGRSKILIHVANYATDVQGCIGVGFGRSGLMVLNSRSAMTALRKLIQGEFVLAITNEIPEYP